ncbi:hypothetical protein OPT61_g1020 [Boeremia exigua]|uniref:Uncharacterized protein n=1 Tax=Boeremia exigua TaxID=749465 RepID=A0ACC2IS66_9PLEO|nr:hypothetical protein OPT61_g1020 [Boeremia exigua]
MEATGSWDDVLLPDLDLTTLALTALTGAFQCLRVEAFRSVIKYTLPTSLPGNALATIWALGSLRANSLIPVKPVLSGRHADILRPR